MFDSFKKLFSKGSKVEEKNQQVSLIDEDLEEFEREIQEYISYTEEPGSPATVEQPANLSKGGAIASSSIITPEEQKRIDNS